MECHAILNMGEERRHNGSKYGALIFGKETVSKILLRHSLFLSHYIIRIDVSTVEEKKCV